MHPSKPIRFFQSKKKRLEPKGSRRLCLFVLPAHGPDAVIVTRAIKGQTIAVDRQGIPHATEVGVDQGYAVVVPESPQWSAKPVFGDGAQISNAWAEAPDKIQNSANCSSPPQDDAIFINLQPAHAAEIPTQRPRPSALIRLGPAIAIHMQRPSTTMAIYQATPHDNGAVQLPLKNG